MKKILWIIASLLIWTSCKKKDTDPQNLLLGKWTMTDYIHDGNNVFPAAFSPCWIDNILTFASNNQVISDEGPTKCDPADPQTITESYTFDANSKLLVFSANGSTETDYVKTLTSTTLKVELQSNGDLITYTRVP